MNKIYIIGPVGSGKTTFAKKISKELNIPFYELDSFVWKSNGKDNIKRTYEETNEIFKKVFKQDKWIFEDVGRSRFEEAIKIADLVIYLDTCKRVINKRILVRWLKQIFGLEKCTYKPTLKMLFSMYKWHYNDQKNKPEKISSLKVQAKKMVILNEKTIKDFKIEKYE